jgi:hypothetical protein
MQALQSPSSMSKAAGGGKAAGGERHHAAPSDSASITFLPATPSPLRTLASSHLTFLSSHISSPFSPLISPYLPLLSYLLTFLSSHLSLPSSPLTSPHLPLHSPLLTFLSSHISSPSSPLTCPPPHLTSHLALSPQALRAALSSSTSEQLVAPLQIFSASFLRRPHPSSRSTLLPGQHAYFIFCALHCNLYSTLYSVFNTTYSSLCSVFHFSRSVIVSSRVMSVQVPSGVRVSRSRSAIRSQVLSR